MSNELTRTTSSGQEVALTDLQKNFLENLFGEARGNPTKAAELAGSKSPYVYGHSTAKALKDLIVERAKDVLAVHGPQAAFAMVDVLSKDNPTPLDQTKVRVATEILDRIGIGKKQELKIDHTIEHNIFYIPEKNEIDAKDITYEVDYSTKDS